MCVCVIAANSHPAEMVARNGISLSLLPSMPYRRAKETNHRVDDACIIMNTSSRRQGSKSRRRRGNFLLPPPSRTVTALLIGWCCGIVVITAPTAMAQTSVCAPDCGPFGECLECTAVDNCVGERCRCDDNYAGDDCSLRVEYCPGSVDADHSVSTCLNGGKCVAKEEIMASMERDTQVWRCDCTTAVGHAKAYAGIQCEFPSTRSCLVGRTESDYAFCANGGDCLTYVLEGEDHPGCKNCPGFEGRHCQYVEGTAPPEERAAAHATIEQDNGMKAGGVFLVVLLAATTLGCLVLLVIRRQRRQKGAGGDGDNNIGATTASGSGDVPTDLILEEKGAPPSEAQPEGAEAESDEKPEIV